MTFRLGVPSCLIWQITRRGSRSLGSTGRCSLYWGVVFSLTSQYPTYCTPHVPKNTTSLWAALPLWSWLRRKPFCVRQGRFGLLAVLPTCMVIVKSIITVRQKGFVGQNAPINATVRYIYIYYMSQLNKQWMSQCWIPGYQSPGYKRSLCDISPTVWIHRIVCWVDKLYNRDS